MKELRFRNGGRARANNDLQTLQNEMNAAITAQYNGLTPCVVSGCELYPQGGGVFNIGHGLVWIEGGVYRFDGQGAVTLPVELYLAAEVLSDLRPYQTGGSDYCMGERKAMTRAVTNATTAILVTADGIIDFNKAREGKSREAGEGGFLFNLNTSGYDATGKGKYGTKAYGWQLTNNQNGAPNTDGRFLFGYGLGVAVGAKGGVADVQLTANQNGQHTHQMDQAGSHTHTYDDQSNREDNIVDAGGNTRYIQKQNQTKTTSPAGSHVHTIQDSGLGEAHTNIPPFLAVAFRIWTGF